MREQRGQAVIMGAIVLFALLALSGLAIDLGRMFVVRAELAKAVDGAALAGASVLSAGDLRAQEAAAEYAEMNFEDGFMNTLGHRFTVSLDHTPGRARVAVQGRAIMETTFMRLVGLRTVRVPAFAEAERRPLSVALVLDNSFSLSSDYAGVDAIRDLRTASQEFIGYFDDDMDQMALTLFSTGTTVEFPLGHDFSRSIESSLQGMTTWRKTNLSDAVWEGYEELRNDENLASFRALVFFTDGRPTALRRVFDVNGVSYDAVMAGKGNPSPRPGTGVEDELYRPDHMDDAIDGVKYTAPNFPGTNIPRTSVNLRMLATQDVLDAAAAARRDGITVYTIGLGNPNVAELWKQPDSELLIQMANAPSGFDPRDGSTYTNPNYDPNQPRGDYYFAPNATELASVFDQVARQIVLRLTQ
jgi:Flp pilus assembly protein TadG